MPLHPKLVHLPIALAVLMPLVSAGLLAAWWRSLLPRRTWLVAVGLQLLLVGSAVVAIQAGQRDEERVERVVSERVIDAHEEAAETFTWAAGVVLAVMLAGTAVPRERTARAIAGAAVLGTVVVLGLGYRAGESGGRLVYREGAAQVYVADAATPAMPSRQAARGPRRHDD